MTPKELQRIHVIQQCIDGILTNGETAHILGLSQRQVIRLKKGTKKEGLQSMIFREWSIVWLIQPGDNVYLSSQYRTFKKPQITPQWRLHIIQNLIEEE